MRQANGRRRGRGLPVSICHDPEKTCRIIKGRIICRHIIGMAV